MNKGEILKNLKEYGICVLKDYWTREQCLNAKREVDSLPSGLFVPGQGNDSRCQHSNNYLEGARSFFEDQFIIEISEEYSACCVPNRTVTGIVRYTEGVQVDSGGGWHVDSEQDSQFKSILYLSDVHATNGPFTFATKSKEKVPELEKYSNLRISEEQINEKILSENIVEIVGTAGTCILVDTTYPHRGKLIQSGERYSFTTYFYKDKN